MLAVQLRSRAPGKLRSHLAGILQYISSGWDNLTRSINDCKTFEDAKTDGNPILYFPSDLPIPPAVQELQKRCPVQTAHLPA